MIKQKKEEEKKEKGLLSHNFRHKFFTTIGAEPKKLRD